MPCCKGLEISTLSPRSRSYKLGCLNQLRRNSLCVLDLEVTLLLSTVWQFGPKTVQDMRGEEWIALDLQSSNLWYLLVFQSLRLSLSLFNLWPHTHTHKSSNIHKFSSKFQVSIWDWLKIVEHGGYPQHQNFNGKHMVLSAIRVPQNRMDIIMFTFLVTIHWYPPWFRAILIMVSPSYPHIPIKSLLYHYVSWLNAKSQSQIAIINPHEPIFRPAIRPLLLSNRPVAVSWCHVRCAIQDCI